MDARSNLMISLLVNVTSEVDFDQNSLLFKETLYFRMADEMKQLFPEVCFGRGETNTEQKHDLHLDVWKEVILRHL
jgi:hypothetical protein